MSNRNEVLEATHYGSLKIGAVEIPCFVLDDGRRVLNQSGMFKALDVSSAISLEGFLARPVIKDHVTSTLVALIENQTRFTVRNRRGAQGWVYDADLLIEICTIILDAESSVGDREGHLIRTQLKKYAERARFLLRIFGKTGITALIDEATGYESARHEALQTILNRFVKKEFSTWIKRFPDEFFREMFRLNGWEWRDSPQRPMRASQYIVEVVYNRLAPGLVKELRKKNPKDSKGNRKRAHHQWLSDQVGGPELASHVRAVIGLMRSSKTWGGFMRLLNRSFPVQGDQMDLLLEDGEEELV